AVRAAEAMTTSVMGGVLSWQDLVISWQGRYLVAGSSRGRVGRLDCRMAPPCVQLGLLRLFRTRNEAVARPLVRCDNRTLGGKGVWRWPRRSTADGRQASARASMPMAGGPKTRPAEGRTTAARSTSRNTPSGGPTTPR